MTDSMMGISERSHSVESAALSALYEFAKPRGESCELTDRDYHLFIAGVKFCGEVSKIMARPEFQDGVIALAAVFGNRHPVSHGDEWREVRRV